MYPAPAFPLDGTLGIAELQYAYPSLGATVHGGSKTPLSRTYKLGAMYDNVKFDDQRFDNTGPLSGESSKYGRSANASRRLRALRCRRSNALGRSQRE